MPTVVSTLKSFFSGDTLFISAALVLGFCYAMFMGRGKMISLILAFYPATILFNGFPFINKLLLLHGDVSLLLNKILIFLVFLVPLTIIINRFIFSALEYSGLSGILRNLSLAVAFVSLLLIFTHTTITIDALHNFSPKIDALFTGLDRIFYWNVGVILLLAFS